MRSISANVASELTILLASCLLFFASGCKREYTYGVDPDAAANMLLGVPNLFPTPDSMEVFKSTRGRRFAFWQDFDSKTNNLIFASTNKSEIAGCVERLRAEGRVNPPLSGIGRTYFLRFRYTKNTNEMHYRYFVADETNAPSFVGIHTGLTVENLELRRWLESRKLLESR